MKLPTLLTGGLLLLCVASLHAAKPTPAASSSASKPSTDDTVRLQIFLDEQNFGPGKIDGSYGGFTAKSWHNYQQAQGISPVSDKFDAKTFTSVDPTYTTYTVAADDLNAIGTVPKELKEQEKQKSLPYTSMPELLGERYHVGVDFLHVLNKGHDIDHLKEGDKVKVPNVVPPFNLSQVIALRQYTAERKKALAAAKETAKDKGLTPDPAAAASPGATPPAEMPGPTVAVSASPPPADAVPTVASVSPEAALATATPRVSDSPGPDTPAPAAAADNRPVLRAAPADSKSLVFYVNTEQSYLEIHQGDRMVACFPITPGSTAIPTPKGEWHVVAKTLLPEFRWDKSVLMTGKRSDTAFQLPPGPNNPVGITWIALNKPGIGMHGTATPDTIGRSASHGCIRLSNWDAFKVFGMVAPGTKVIIE